MKLYDLKILRVLDIEERASPEKAITILQARNALPEQARKSYMTTYRHMHKLADKGYLKCGLDDGLASTYFITDMGRTFLKITL